MSTSTSVYSIKSSDVELDNIPEPESKNGVDKGKDGGKDEGKDDNKRTGVKELIAMYASKSTVHGLPSTVESTQYKGQRLFWLLLVVGMLVALVTVLTLQIQDYYSYPTAIDIHEKYLTVHDIPEITICKQETKVFHGKMNWTGDDARNYAGVHTESVNMFGCGSEQNYSGECILNKTREVELTRLMKSGLDQVWTTFEDLKMTEAITDMGLCDTFKTSHFIELTRGRTNDTSKAPLDLILAVYKQWLFTGERMGLQVSLHLKGEPPLPRKNRVQIAINKSCRINYKKVNRRSLTTPFVSFVGEQCVESHLPSFKNPLTRYSVYSKDTCLEECFVNFTIAQCGCRYYLHPGLEEMCNLTMIFKCMELTRIRFPQHKTKCHCPPPCEYTQFETSVSCSEINRPPFDMVHLEIVSDIDMVTEIVQEPVYTIETILGTLGDLIGLFMGFSVVSLIELLELICLTLSCRLCTRRSPPT